LAPPPPPALRVRMGLHTGEPTFRDGTYFGMDVHKAARIAAAGHGVQVLLSNETRDLAPAAVSDLGEHRLKGFTEPVSIFQLGRERFPPLKTISNSNLPRPANTFVGRQREVKEVRSLLVDGTRFLTLTGPGGSGKTRLAIEAAAELVPEFRNGVSWVELAALREPGLVVDAIAQTLGAKDVLAEHIGQRELLLVIDNFEQVVDAAPTLARLVESCSNLRLLVTSREKLGVRGEVEYPVSPLSEPEAVELFCTRARLEPGAAIAELCRRLDNLPLAVELAAARTNVLSPGQILDRLAQRLDLLVGGRDADARQKTLRATIAWSHGLLDEPEKRLFARLGVFAPHRAGPAALARAALGGVVTAVAAPIRLEAVIDGHADHSGATPMDDRRDALCAAAELVLAVEAAARDEAAFDSVATSARVTCLPGAINVVPGRAEVLVDVRGVDLASMERLVERIRVSAEATSARRGVRLALTTLSRGTPTVLSEPVVRMLADTVRQLGDEPLLLPSGAGHDAQCLAATAAVGMLFVPSVGGLSHCPEELTRPDDVVAGVQALAAGWLRLAAVATEQR
jgi:hypothetical protein